MIVILSHIGGFHHRSVGAYVCVCAETVVREEEEIVCNNRKGGWCSRYSICVSVCVQIGKFPLQP